MEMKIIISYIAICLTYSVCRLHYLLTVKEDAEFNDMLGELIDLSGNKDIIKIIILLQLLLSPILAPFSMVRQLIKLLFLRKS